MTVSPEGPSLRDAAGSFGQDAERYDRTRPSYPQEMVDALLAAVPCSPGRPPAILDVGIGTGIAAEQLRAAGARVSGIDVDERMAALARARGFEVQVARFEDWDAAGRTFDAVVAGQAWHWVEPGPGAAAAARALRPGGRFAAFWNVFQAPPALAAALDDVHRRVMPPQLAGMFSRPPLEQYGAMCARAAGGLRASGAFGEPERWRFDWQRVYARDEWLDQVPTQGAYTRLPGAALDEILAGVGAAIDAVGGSFTADYATLVVTAVRATNG